MHCYFCKSPDHEIKSCETLKTYVCKKCGKTGHSGKACMTPDNELPKREYVKRQPHKREYVKTCQFCHKEDHIKKDCEEFEEYKKNLFCSFCGITGVHSTNKCDNEYNSKNAGRITLSTY